VWVTRIVIAGPLLAALSGAACRGGDGELAPAQPPAQHGSESEVAAAAEDPKPAPVDSGSAIPGPVPGTYEITRDDSGAIAVSGEGIRGVADLEAVPRGAEGRSPVTDSTRNEALEQHAALLRRLPRRADGSVDVPRAVTQMARERRIEEEAATKLLAEAMRGSDDAMAREWVEALEQEQEPTPRLDTMSLCAAALLDCATIHMAEKGEPSLADSDIVPCVDEVPTCRGDLRAVDEDCCCPIACKEHFRELPAGGDVPIALGFHKAIFEEQCVPGEGI